MRLPNFLALLFFFILPVSGKIYAQCNCDFTITNGNFGTTFDGNSRGVQPGDVICIDAGFREKITFRNITGSPTNYVTIKNCGGKAEIGGSNVSNSLTFLGSRYIHITGTGDPGTEYGIKIRGSRAGSQGLLCAGKSSDIEIDHVEITAAGFAGIMIKDDPKCGDRSFERDQPGAFTMYNISVHDNYLHDIGGEGLYMGNSFYKGTTVYCGFTQYPHEIRGVRVYNNLVENTGWEALQIGAAVEDVEVYNNTIINYGFVDKPSQNGGIQMGVGSTGRLYNNFVKGGGGPALVIQGIGENYVYNNIVINPGAEAINVNTRPTPLASDIVPNGYLGGIYVMNNTIVNATSAGVKENINTAPGNVLYNNLIVNSTNNWDQRKTNTDWDVSNNLAIPSISGAMFENAATDDYRIQSGSPAKNAGRDLNSFGVVVDHSGSNRPTETVYDIGAHEFQANEPSCDAGPNRNITLPTNSTTLTGSASSPNGPITTYAWTKSQGGSVTLQNENTATLQLTNLLEGVYEFQLTVTDNTSVTCSDVATVTVSAPPNNSPTANAGPNQTITLPTNSITINGSGSDTDGTITTYAWTQVSGAVPTINGANTANLQLSGLLEGTYEFRLTVTDDGGATGTDVVRITVNPAAVNQDPTVNAGSNQTIFLPTNSIVLNAVASDPDGTIAQYLWEKRSGPTANLVNETTTNLTAQNLVEGVYVFRITVTDNDGATAFDEVQVSVVDNNQAPTANAGSNQTITLPTNTIVLNGSGSDTDGTIATYAWTQVSALAGTLVNDNTPDLTVNSMVQGNYTFGLTVTDNDGATGYDEVQVTVNAAPVNQPPNVNAGADRSIILPTNSITLTGAASDPDGTIASYSWNMSGPGATLGNTNNSTLNVTDMVAGNYVFTVTVTDNDGATVQDQVVVAVFPVDVNQTPVANAGGNKVITLPINFVILNGAGNDPDGTIASFTWTLESGPAATLVPSNEVLDVTNMIEGVYVFKLEVTDNEGATSSDFATVTVSASNLAPVVNAGEDQVLVLPSNAIDLTATASDPDGVIASYSWLKLSGGAATLGGANTNTLNVTGLVAGDYVFQVTATDDDGTFSSDEVAVRVLANGSNLPPVVNAGSDEIIFLPTNTITIAGTASDPDGTISTYSWTKISAGPGNLINNTTSTVTITGLGVGVNEFELTATDNGSASTSDRVIVIVNPASTNQTPTANAGGNKNIQLPTNSVILAGSASDPDGSIQVFQWAKVSGPAATLSNATNSSATAGNLVEGTYVFRLTVTDNSGATAFDEAIVNVLPASVNLSPLADAGANQTLILPLNSTNLVGIGSDADGTVNSYLWTNVSGPATFTLLNSSLPVATLTGLIEGTYVFRLTVTDDAGATGADEVQVRVNVAGTNVPPIADAGGNQVLTLPNNSINLFGTGSDQDGSVTTYQWIKVSGDAANLVNANSATLTVNGLVAGSYVFRLRVTDNDGATNDDRVTVIVNPETVNIPPIVTAGADKVIFLPTNTTNMIGASSDEDGQVTSINWEQVSGPTASLNNVTQNNLLLSNLTEGTYVLRLNAEDNEQATAYDEATLTVLPAGTNQPPVITLDATATVFLPVTDFTIDALVEDADGTISTYIWSKVSGPNLTLTNDDQEDVTISNLVEGQYTLQLNVIDNQGASTSEQILVTVLPAGVNQAPVVNAGDDVEITLPTNSVTLNGTAIDNNGTITTTQWQKVLGPAATLTGDNTLTLQVTNLLEGRYTFSLTATDNEGATSTDEVRVRVNPIPPNQPPVVNAGSNLSIILPPAGALEFQGTAVDEDGSVSTLQWTQEGGPSPVTLGNTNALDLEVSDIVDEGLYTFRLTATDNDGDSAFDNVFLFAALDSIESIITNILAFSFPGQTVPSQIDFVEKTILATAPTGSDLASLVADFELTEGALVRVGATVQESGVTANDFTQPVIYTVLAPEGTNSKDWTITVEVGDGVSIPKYFSPNNDGIADFWEINDPTITQVCKVEVFSRNGLLVFEAEPYENNWDGTSNGKQLQEGDYYYIISCNGQKLSAGGVRIIR